MARAATKKPEPQGEIQITPVQRESATFAVVCDSPLIYNRMAAKGLHELLLPAGPRRKAADRAAGLKHDPVFEFRDSVLRHRDDSHPTRLFFKPEAFKKAMMTAALELPGLTKSGIGRQIWVPDEPIDVYGIPELFMAVVRNSDINHTPDVRTRAKLKKWACFVNVRFARPILKPNVVANLLGAAGIFAGIGDFRQEKGAGSFGQFRIVNPDDAEFRDILKRGGRAAQDEALLNYRAADSDSEELLSWFEQELVARKRDDELQISAPANKAAKEPRQNGLAKSNGKTSPPESRAV